MTSGNLGGCEITIEWGLARARARLCIEDVDSTHRGMLYAGAGMNIGAFTQRSWPGPPSVASSCSLLCSARTDLATCTPRESHDGSPSSIVDIPVDFIPTEHRKFQPIGPWSIAAQAQADISHQSDRPKRTMLPSSIPLTGVRETPGHFS